MHNQPSRNDKQVKIGEENLHPHLRDRMSQRGVTLQEIVLALNEGWEASDARSGMFGKVMIFPYNEEWEGRTYEEKEVTVYYKIVDGNLVLLTVKARYGKDFPRGE